MVETVGFSLGKSPYKPYLVRVKNVGYVSHQKSAGSSSRLVFILDKDFCVKDFLLLDKQIK
jgi:hypothetical protein